MNIDVLFSVGRAYNVKRIDVLKGESFTVTTNAPEGTRWFADNDKVLTIEAEGNKALIKADNTGASEIHFVNGGNAVDDILYINVVESLELAESLNATGENEPK